MTIIKNLSQLKKAIKDGKRFKIVNHYRKPETIGQIRKPNVIQTNGFYSWIDGQPEHQVSRANHGKGYWLAYGKASEWKFEEGICKLNNVFDIMFID